MVFHLLLHKQKLLQSSTGHFIPSPGGKWVVFKSLPPDYPRASGNQPRDTTVRTRLYHFSQSTEVLQTSLCAGVLYPIGIPLVPFTFQLLYTCLMQIYRNKLFIFSCLQGSLISVVPPSSHHSSNTITEGKSTEIAEKNIYIYIHNWIHILRIHLQEKCITYTPKYIKRILGARHCQQQEIHRKAQSLLL